MKSAPYTRDFRLCGRKGTEAAYHEHGISDGRIADSFCEAVYQDMRDSWILFWYAVF